MSRSIVAILTLAAAITLVAPAGASAQQTQYPCNLGMVMSCSNGQCTSTTANNGSNACTGTIFTGFVAEANTATFTNFQPGISLTGSQCIDSAAFPGQQVNFAWCTGTGSLAAGASFTSTVTTNAPANTQLFALTEVLDPAVQTVLGFAYAVNNATAGTCTPDAGVPNATLAGVAYKLTWSAVSEPGATYMVDESTTPDFSAITSTQTTSATSLEFQHTAAGRYYYRVRATTCGGQPGTYSNIASILVQAPPTPSTTGTTDVVVPFGTTTPFVIPMPIQLPTSDAGYAFSATTDQPSFYSVMPPSGTVPASGLLNLAITASPANLPPGASTGTLLLTLTPPVTANRVQPLASTTVSLPVSVTLVTPVTPGAKSLPPANALVIPAVGHLVGQGNTPFVSDVRLTNASTSAINYQVTYTAANPNGATTGQITNVTVQPGTTIALNDVAKDFFGVGASGTSADTGLGALEIRPTNSASLATYVSSRTYATTSSGTYGQFIAAIPFSQFASAVSQLPANPYTPAPPSNATISFQQVAQSDRFHTNLGLVEGSGTPAKGTINIYDDNGTLVKSVPLDLNPGQQTQISLPDLGVTNLDDGRIEIKVTSPTGAVTGYASVADNITHDPLAVIPVVPSSIHATRYVLPGIAEYVFPDGRNFHSDMRVFNGGTNPANVTLTLYGADATGKAVTIPAPAFTLAPGQVERLDNVLANYFKLGAGSNYGGAVVATSDSDSSLVVTGRTYSSNADGGTFGQFIPGVTPGQGIRLGDRPLQILQLEQSAQFRSNIGLAEVSGNPVDGKITLILPDAKVAPIYPFHLDANSFLQPPLANILPASTTAYNVRAIVEVTGGSGKLAAYGSVVDRKSSDPTYVPAQ